MLLGLDVGDKRVGTAIIDKSTGRARAFKTFDRANYAAEKAIIELIAEHQVKTLIVGLPLGAQLQETPQALKVKNFCRRLLKRVVIDIIYVDEYLTSEEAADKLGIRGKKMAMTARRRGDIDSMSAAIILEKYLKAQQV